MIAYAVYIRSRFAKRLAAALFMSYEVIAPREIKSQPQEVGIKEALSDDDVRLPVRLSFCLSLANDAYVSLLRKLPNQST